LSLSELISALSGLEAAELQSVIASAAGILAARSNGHREEPPDELIDVHKAATILGVSESYLSHNMQPFTVKIGGRRMFSKAGIQRFIARNAGKD
jgi:hypothetical protein